MNAMFHNFKAAADYRIIGLLQIIDLTFFPFLQSEGCFWLECGGFTK